MTTQSNPWNDNWVSAPKGMRNHGHVLGRWQARRMSRHFAGVGVNITAGRLRQLASGVPAAEEEMSDVRFALTATAIGRADRHAKLVHAKRRAMFWLVFLGMVLAALSLLLGMAYVLLSLTQTAPY